MKYKHCLQIFIDLDTSCKKLVDDFISLTSKKYMFCDDPQSADIVISDRYFDNKINVLVSKKNNIPTSQDDHCYFFQPFLYNKTGDLNSLGPELEVFVEHVVNDYNLPYKKPHTILIVH